MKYKIIVNPVAGRGAAERAVPEIERLLHERDLDFDLVRTERPMHAAELARDAADEGFDVVVAAGGDGTANEALNGLVRRAGDGVNGVSLGVLCVGRGNDFAFGAGIPAGLEAGCDVLAAGRRRRIDVGWVESELYPEGRYFGNGVGIGFDAVVGFEAHKFKRLSGMPSYVLAALKTAFLYYHPPLVELRCDDAVTVLSTLMVSVMNGRRMGGGFMMAPESSSDDGLFDLCIAGDVPKLAIFPLIARFMQGTQGSHPEIHAQRAREVQVTALEGALPAHADGETLCVSGQSLRIGLLPQKLDVLSANGTGS